MVIVQALIVVLAGGVLALLFEFGKTRWIYGREVKKDRLKEIGGFITLAKRCLCVGRARVGSGRIYRHEGRDGGEYAYDTGGAR